MGRTSVVFERPFAVQTVGAVAAKSPGLPASRGLRATSHRRQLWRQQHDRSQPVRLRCSEPAVAAATPWRRAHADRRQQGVAGLSPSHRVRR